MTIASLDRWLLSSSDENADRARVGDSIRGHETDDMRDVRLLALVQQSNTRAFEELFGFYVTPLRRFVRAMVHSAAPAEDIVQDVFVSLWERRATVAVKTTVRAYLYASARGRALTALRAAGTREAYVARSMSDDVTILPRAVPDALAALEWDELMRALRVALMSLPPRVRQAAELRWFGKLTQAEIGAVMGTSPATVNNQVTAALKSLREQLKPHFSDSE